MNIAIAFSETERILLVSAHALAAVPFVVNGSGLIPQEMALRELKQAGFCTQHQCGERVDAHRVAKQGSPARRMVWS
jgi:hypothetical protein